MTLSTLSWEPVQTRFCLRSMVHSDRRETHKTDELITPFHSVLVKVATKPNGNEELFIILIVAFFCHLYQIHSNTFNFWLLCFDHQGRFVGCLRLFEQKTIQSNQWMDSTRFLSRQRDAIFVALKLHQVSNMFETPAISRQQIALKIAPGLHMRFWSCNFRATKIALSCCDKNRLCKRAFGILVYVGKVISLSHQIPTGVPIYLRN